MFRCTPMLMPFNSGIKLIAFSKAGALAIMLVEVNIPFLNAAKTAWFALFEIPKSSAFIISCFFSSINIKFPLRK